MKRHDPVAQVERSPAASRRCSEIERPPMPRKVKRKGGTVWEVRYREHGHHRSRVFDTKRDADLFTTEIRQRKRLGTLGQMDAGEVLVSAFAVEWWQLHAETNLERSTRESYASIWDKHVLPRVGEYPLREITPELVAKLRAELTASGVGDATTRKALYIFQSVLAHAVLRGLISHNPVKAVKKPRHRPASVRPLAPATVEAMRFGMDPADATLISVLAYAGLRPGEALALRWHHVRERTILVESSISFGEEKGTKTQRTRTVRILQPLVADLREWRLGAGRPDESSLVFARPGGAAWKDHDWRNWRRRVYQPAAKAAGVASRRPYDLRHSFVSLLIQEGVSIVEVARQAGHAPEECLKTYAHVFEEIDPGERRPAAEVIGTARRDVRSAA